MRFLLLIGLTSLLAGPVAAAERVPNASFEAPLTEGWETTPAATGRVQRDAERGQEGGASVRVLPGKGEVCVSLAGTQRLGAEPGQAFKLLVWVRVEGAVGKNTVALDGYRGGKFVSTLAVSRSLGDTSGFWAPRWVVGTVPEDGSVTHLSVALRSGEGTRTVWFDDVTLRPLPADKPSYDGPVAPPPRGGIRAADGHLVGEDGKRIRFWGMNCVDEMGRTYREIDQIVHRIKQMGFNALRLHLYDIRLIDTDARNAKGEATSRRFRRPGQRGDGSKLDKFDYFMYRAEREGLYMYLTFDRLRGRFQPGDYDILPTAGEADEAAWKEAVGQANAKGTNEHLYYVDERLGAVQAEYVRQHLEHRNAYTGRRIADDPYVALYELTNENGVPMTLIEGTFDKWPTYFRSGYERRWAAWLRQRYRSVDELRQAWGLLGEGDDFAAGSFALPVGTAGKGASAGRVGDYRRFVYETVIGYSQRLHGIIRNAGTAAAQAPVTYDTVYKHKHTWYYPASQGTCLAVGTYAPGVAFPGKSRGRLGTPFRSSYNMSNATVADKPTVIYETNVHKPATYRAGYPLWIAAFTGLRDWDGVFWYDWTNGTVLDQVDADVYAHVGLRYSSPGHIWHGIVSGTDEVLLASMRIAGEMFKQGAIPPMPKPVEVTVGANDLLGARSWLGDLTLPYPAEAAQPYPRAYAMAATDFVSGCRYRYRLDVPKTQVTTPFIAAAPRQLEPSPGVAYDFDKGTLTFDLPTAKVVVGFAPAGHTFSDGVQLGAVNRPFVCFGLVSTDGKPLSTTKSAVLVACSTGENRAMRTTDKPEDRKPKSASKHSRTVTSWGFGPADLQRVGTTVQLGRDWRWTLRDFALRKLRQGDGATLRLGEKDPLFWAELTVE